MFRYRLWRLRDRIVDDTFANRLSAGPAASRLLSLIETTIRLSAHITLFQFLLVPVSQEDVQQSQARFKESRNALPEDEKRLFATYEEEFFLAAAGYLLFGSIFGWIVVLLAGPFLVIAYIVRLVKRMSFETKSLLDHISALIRDMLSPVRKHCVISGRMDTLDKTVAPNGPPLSELAA